MKKYVIIIGKNNEEVSRKVQEKLFEHGFEWAGGGRVVDDLCKPFLWLNTHCRWGSLVYSEDVDLAARRIMEEGHVAVTPECVLKYCHLLDGAKKPVKKMTVAEVCKELGYDVEIVK